MAKKKKAAKKFISKAAHNRKKGKHMVYYCRACGTESNKKIGHHGRMMEKC